MPPKRTTSKQSTRQLSSTVEFLKSISDANRLKILRLLQAGEKCVCDIWQDLNLAQNLTSHHLKVLRDLGLISPKKEGQKVIYSLNRQIISMYLKLLNQQLNPYEPKP